MKKPKVSIIILNYNGLADTRGCLKSVLTTEYSNFEVLVGDNASINNEISILSKEFKDKRIKFVRFSKNWGYAGGNNRLIKKAKSKYVVLLNNDTKVTPKWLEELVKTAEEDEKIAAVQPKIRSLYEPKYFEYAGAAGGFLDKLGYPYARGRIGFHLEKDVGQYNDAVDLCWGSGACVLLKKSVLKISGLLPENFFFYHEETDLCWRLRNLGYRIVFSPKAVIYHKGASSSKKNMVRRIFFVHRNNLLLIFRNMSFTRLIWVLPLRLVLDILAVGFYLLTKKPQFLLSVAGAHLSFAARLPFLIVEKGKIPRKDFLAEKQMIPFSIFWEYFVKGKRRFNEILGKRGDDTPLIYYEDLLSLKRIAGLKERLTTVLNILATKKVFLFLLIIIIALLLRLPSLAIPLDRDEGTYAYIGWAWLREGLVPYRDIFDHKPPLPYLVYAFLGFIGGNNLLSIRVGSMLYFFATLLIFYYFTYRWWGKWASLVLSLILLFLTSSTNVEGWGFNTEALFIPWVLLAFGLVKESLDAGSKTNLYKWFLIGIIGGLAGLFKQVGHIPIIGLLISLGVWEWISKRKNFKRIFFLGLGMVIPSLATLAYFDFQGSFQQYITTNFLFNKVYLVEGLILKNVQAATGLSGIILPYIKWLVGIRFWEVKIAIALFAVSGFLFFKHKKWLELAGGVILVVGLFVGAKLAGIREVGHYYLPLIWGAVFFSGGIFLKNSKLSQIIRYLIVIVVIFKLLQGITLSGKEISRKQFGSQEEWFSDSHKVGEQLDKSLKSGETLYVWANEPQIYYYARTLSPTYFLHFFQLDNYPDGWQIWEKDIYTAKPDYIVTYISKDEPMYSKLIEYLGINPYEEVEKIGSFRVLKKVK